MQPREAALRDVIPNQQFKSHRGVSAVTRLPSLPTPETDGLHKQSPKPTGTVHKCLLLPSALSVTGSYNPHPPPLTR